MVDIRTGFQEEYRTGTETSSFDESSDELSHQLQSTEKMIEDNKKYGIGKPIRITIRAEIIHDKN